MPKRTSRWSSPTPRKYKRARKHNGNVNQNTSQQGKQDTRLALIAEVKKYPILCTSLDVDEDSETCYGAWEKIAEKFQTDDCMSLSPMGCIKIWKSIKRSFINYIMCRYIYTRGAVTRAMQCLFPDFNEENLLDTVEDDNDALNNSSKVGSDTAEEMIQPKTNHTVIRKYLRVPTKKFKLAFIAEVKKYPVLCASLDVDADSETCYGAWENIAEALQIDESMSTFPVDYCRKVWKIIKRGLCWNTGYNTWYCEDTEVVLAMLHLFPEAYENSGKKDAVNNSSENNAAGPEPQSVETSEGPVICNSEDEDVYWDRCVKAWDKIVEALQIKAGADENNELNNSSEIGSAEEIIPPTTNDTAGPEPQLLKKKLYFITKHLVQFTNSEGRHPIVAFMKKPGKEQFPVYYDVIDKPIDVVTIEANIRNDRYNSVEEMISDYRVMFSNCRQYNEEDCKIYKDACLLERVMDEKLKELNRIYEKKTSSKVIKAAKPRQPRRDSGKKDAANNSSDVGSVTAENNAAGPEPQPYPTGTEFELALIAEVKKYPVICESLHEDIHSIKCYRAWGKIAEALQIKAVDPRIPDHIYHCRSTWVFIMDSFVRYYSGDRYKTNEAVMQAMMSLFPQCKDVYGDSTVSSDPQSDSLDSDCGSDETYHEPRSKKRTAAPPTEEPMCEGADENNELNNSSEVGSAAAESAEEIIPPTTNDTAGPKPQPLKKKLQFITKQLVQFINSDGRQPIRAFMKKPSKEVFPGYYNMIDKPIDVNTIADNIRNGRYNSVEEMISDYRVMFSNCRQVYEEGCMIYEDANSLERVMDEKLKELNRIYEKKTPSKVIKAAKPRQPRRGADENNVLNNSSEVGSAAAESAEEIIPPTTNDTAGPEPQQAVTPSEPRSIGAISAERAVSLAIIDHLFDSLHSPAARADICDTLMQLLHNYRPHVMSDVIAYGARQPSLLKIDWSGLPIPADLCHEIWRRDVEDKLHKAYQNSSSKRRAKKGN